LVDVDYDKIRISVDRKGEIHLDSQSGKIVFKASSGKTITF